MRWVNAIAAAVFLVAGSGATLGGEGVPEPAAPLALAQLFGGPFELVDQDGAVRTDKDFHGRHVLIYFGYTYCPDICPTSLQEMAAALDQLGEQGRDVQPVFVSIDPKRDPPTVLKAYVAQFGERFWGLSGSETAIRKVSKAYRLHRVKVVPDWSQGENDYLVDHSSLTFLLGPDGKVLTLFPHNTPADIMAMRIRTYLAKPPDS